jgi:phage-related holin
MDSFLVLTEAISILENISKLGFPVPTTLVKLLKTYYDKKQG